MPASQQLEIDGRQIRVSNLDKVLFPEAAFTKGQMLDYYQQVAPSILPHLQGRALTLKRYPDGVEGESFFEKSCPRHRPPWVPTVRVDAANARGEVNFCICDDKATLVWLAQLATIELHISLARAEDVQRPTSVMFDLDPGPPATMVECARVALKLRDTSARLGLQTFPKVSGSKGLHIFVPLNTPTSYDVTSPWALAMAEHLAELEPSLVLTNMRRADRTGKVFVDWSQNSPHKTTVCAYSLRAKSQPTVSAPVHWEEIERVVKTGKAARLMFTPKQALQRIEREGDLLALVQTLQQELPDVRSIDAA